MSNHELDEQEDARFVWKGLLEQVRGLWGLVVQRLMTSSDPDRLALRACVVDSLRLSLVGAELRRALRLRNATSDRLVKDHVLSLDDLCSLDEDSLLCLSVDDAYQQHQSVTHRKLEGIDKLYEERAKAGADAAIAKVLETPGALLQLLSDGQVERRLVEVLADGHPSPTIRNR